MFNKNARELGNLLANLAYTAKNNVPNPELVDLYINRLGIQSNKLTIISFSNDLLFLLVKNGIDFSAVSAIREVYEKIDEEDKDTKTEIMFNFFAELGRLNA